MLHSLICVPMNLFVRYGKSAYVYARALARLFWGLLFGRVRSEYIALLFVKNRLRKESLLISILVTATCSLQCEHCIMGNLLRARRGYSLSLEELRAFILISERSGYVFEIMLTGGEPLLWNNLKDALRILRASRMCAGLSLFTNATTIEPLFDAETVSYLDTIKVSQYRHNSENVDMLIRRYPSKVQIFHGEDFYVNPRVAVTHAVPALCLNPELFYFDYHMYACPHSASIAYGSGSTMQLANPLAVGFLKGLERIKHEQQYEICTYCISNEKVRLQVEKVANKGNLLRGRG